MQPRDPGRLESEELDVLIIGGGIYGLAIAYDAASRGLRTALIERADFGSGISFNHQKTVHGGLRSLQSLQLARAREGVRERRAFAKIAPWLVRPLPFMMGTYRSLAKGRTALRAGFALERLLARDRNEGIERELHLPAPKLVSRALAMKLFPGIRDSNLTGGAQWHDYQMVENDRLTLAFAAAAERAGCILANYVEAVDAIRRDGRIAGVMARDVESNRTFEIRASLTINAAGSRAGEVRKLFGIDRPLPLLAAMNLVTSRPVSEVALAAPTSTGRMLTLVPWRGRAIVGTSHSHELVTPAASRASVSELDSFIAEANEAFPALRLTRTDVTLLHRGLVPAVVSNGTPDLLGVSSIEDHSREGAGGAMTVVGVKFTTARAVAEGAVDRAVRLIGKAMRGCTTASQVLPGAGLADHEGLAIETARRAGVDLPAATLARLSTLYAERCADIIQLAAELRELAVPLGHSTAIGAEVAHVIRHEMAVHLSDIVIRRTTLGAAGHPGEDVVRACAAIAGRELQWTSERIDAEIQAVDRFYELPR